MADYLGIGQNRIVARTGYGQKSPAGKADQDRPGVSGSGFAADFEEAMATLKKANGHVQNARSFISSSDAGQSPQRPAHTASRLDLRA
jgi:hypothetical protein